MASVVEIVNRALTKLGERRITSLSDNCKAAAEVSSIYEMVRDAELAIHSWSFALSRVSLAALKDAPLYQYAYAYQKPTDCLRIMEINSSFGQRINDYSTEGALILTDFPAPLFLKYIKRIVDTVSYPILFAEVLATKLAVELAESLTSSSTKKERILREYQEILNKAKRLNALEKIAEKIPEPSWITSRY